MEIDELLTVATAGSVEIGNDWMPATGVRPLIMGDPAVLWLERFGKKNGFEPDESPYDFLGFISGKARQFEEKWISQVAPAASMICSRDYEVRSIGKVFETICVPEYLSSQSHAYGGQMSAYTAFLTS